MAANINNIRRLDLDGKRVLVRVDFNVPFKEGGIHIADDSRIRAALPTLEYLRERNCRIIVCSHRGRPKGKVDQWLRMWAITGRLARLLKMTVIQAGDSVGAGVVESVEGLEPGGVLVLENLRFYPGEEENAPEFAQQLASLADVYINDAFGAAHRAHASTEGVARLLPSAAGFLMERELQILGEAMNAPKRPFAAVLGGAKVSDKIGALQNLTRKADLVLIGGGMAATFISAQGHPVGDSPIEEDRLEFAKGLIAASDAAVGQGDGARLLIPTDVVVADEFAEDAAAKVVSVSDIPDGYRVMDIGPETARRYAEALGACKTVVWNGPMGVFEWPAFSQGTAAIANALAELQDAATITGGGSTAEAVAALGLADRITHISSGGGATLEFMAGKELPGVAALAQSR